MARRRHDASDRRDSRRNGTCERGNPRVLLVAYRFPPQGGGGVQRSAKLAKIWGRSGFPVAVLAGPRHGVWPEDPSLRREIPPQVPCLNVPDPGPWFLAARLRKRLPRGGLWRFVDRALAAIMGVVDALSLPDAHAGWLLPAVWKGYRQARRFDATAILVTAPPWTPILVGAVLGRLLRIPLVLDYRDPWTFKLYPAFPPDTAPVIPGLTRLRRRLSRWMERRALSRASAVVVAHRGILRDARTVVGPGAARGASRRLWVPNGYDPEDFSERVSPDRDQFVMTYTGSLFDWRSPHTLLRVLAKLLESGTLEPASFRLRLVGKAGPARALSASEGVLAGVLEVRGYEPHLRSVTCLRESTVNLVLEGDLGGPNRHTPGKVYETLFAGRPVLLLCPEGTTTRLARRVGGCRIAHPEDEASIAGMITDLYRAWRAGELPSGPDPGRLGFYDRWHQAARLQRFLTEIRRAEGSGAMTRR